MAARSAASLAKRRSRRRVTFAAAAARSSSAFVTISRDRIFIPDFGLRPSDIAHLPPLSIEPPRARQLAARTRALDRKRYNFIAIRASLVRHLRFVDLIVPRHRHSLMLLSFSPVMRKIVSPEDFKALLYLVPIRRFLTLSSLLNK